MFSSVLGAPKQVGLDLGTCPKGGTRWSATAPGALWGDAGYVLGPVVCGGLQQPELCLLRRQTSILTSRESNAIPEFIRIKAWVSGATSPVR